MDQEIVNALKKIKDVCFESECSKCYFGRLDGVCVIMNYTPADWDIKDEKSIYRYFEN